MARKPRILYPGALYHVYNRGNDRHPVYRDDEATRVRVYDFLSHTSPNKLIGYPCRFHPLS